MVEHIPCIRSLGWVDGEHRVHETGEELRLFRRVIVLVDHHLRDRPIMQLGDVPEGS